jgi:hypothetical protein
MLAAQALFRRALKASKVTPVVDAKAAPTTTVLFGPIYSRHGG